MFGRFNNCEIFTKRKDKEMCIKKNIEWKKLEHNAYVINQCICKNLANKIYHVTKITSFH